MSYNYMKPKTQWALIAILFLLIWCNKAHSQSDIVRINDSEVITKANLFTVSQTKAHVKITTDDPAVYKQAQEFFEDSISYINIQYRTVQGAKTKRFVIYLPIDMKDEVDSYGRFVNSRR
jgi:hypothetical protein